MRRPTAAQASQNMAWLAALLILMLASGEREKDLRRRLEAELEAEQAFSEAVALETNAVLEEIRHGSER